MASKFLTLFSLFVFFAINQNVYGKIYGRCELAWELYTYHNVPMSQLSKWVCLASILNYDTSPSAGEKSITCHGMFGICQGYWCEIDKYGAGCNMMCSDFTDDYISDDVHCVKIVLRAHTVTQGDGLKGFGSKYTDNCMNDTVSYIEGCFS